MSIIDFTEIPEAHKATGDQDLFELFARDFLEALSFRIIEGPGRGADRGRDLIVSETIRGTVSNQDKVWVVSAKHKAHSGDSVTDRDESDPIGRVRKFNAHGFMAFYSTLPSSGLDDTLSRIKSEIDVYVFDRGRIEQKLMSQPELQTVFQQYFPQSYEKLIARTKSRLEGGILHREIGELLAKVQSRSVPLSQCMVEALTLAQKASNSSLEIFCRNELSGWYGKDTLESSSKSNHRLIEIFLALNLQINLKYFGWNQDANQVFQYIREHPEEFHPYKLMIGLPIAELEEKQHMIEKSAALVVFDLKLGDVFPETKFDNPDLPVTGYTPTSAFQNVYESVRTELTVRLLDMLPRVNEESVVVL